MTVSVEKSTNSKEFLELVCGIHEELLEVLNYDEMEKRIDDYVEYRKYIQLEIEGFIKDKSFEYDQETIISAVLDEILGFGPVEKLLREAAVTDIFVNNADEVFVEMRGKVERSDIVFLDDEHIYRLVQRVASKSGRHLDLGTPYFDAQLEDGSRLHAIIPPVALNGIKVSIRKFLFNKLELETLVEGGSMTAEMAEFLDIAVKSRFNIVVCGGTGSGKTTLLNTMLNKIRPGERVITIEDVPELEPSHQHMVRLVTRLPNSEGKGGVLQADLMINALRMRPDRVVLGELRGPEAFNLLHAMNTGQDGSMVTLHASGASEVIPRLLNMILMARYSLSADSVRQQIGGALDLIVHVSRLVDGSRRVMAISQVSLDDDGKVLVEDLFRYKISKISPERVKGDHEKLHPAPTVGCLNKLTISGLIDNYFSLFPAEQVTNES